MQHRRRGVDLTFSWSMFDCWPRYFFPFFFFFFFSPHFFYILACFPSFILLPLYSITKCCKVTCTLACTCDLTCDLCFVPATPTRPLSLSAHQSFPLIAGSFCRKYGKKCLKNISQLFAYGYFLMHIY